MTANDEITVTLRRDEVEAFIEATDEQERIVSRFSTTLRESYQSQPLFTGREKLKEVLR